MNPLENYNRDNIYVKNLYNAFDKYIELDKEKIEALLNETDLIEVDEITLPSISWQEIYSSKDLKFQNKLLTRFSYEVNQNHRKYQQILKRFIEEHLKFPNAIIFILKNQVRYIKDVIRRLEIEYFEKPETEYDAFIFSFRDIGLNLLDELISSLKIEYNDYLKGTNLEQLPLLEIEDDSLDFNTVASKVLLMNELGIIDAVRQTNPSMSKSNLAKVISKVTGTHSDTIRRCINDINTSYTNDPYNNETSITKVESLFKLYGLNKKGD